MSNNGYFKKKKMYVILQSMVNNHLDILKRASYRYYRGAEWLECDSIDGTRKYELYRSGNFISLDIFQWEEETERYIEVDRITYRMVEGELIKKYQRTEVLRQTNEMKKWIERRNHNVKSYIG